MNAKMSGLDALGSVEHIATFHALPRRPAFGSRRPILTRALFSKKQKQAAPSKVKDTPCVFFISLPGRCSQEACDVPNGPSKHLAHRFLYFNLPI
jgi:hypothetical protein